MTEKMKESNRKLVQKVKDLSEALEQALMNNRRGKSNINTDKAFKVKDKELENAYQKIKQLTAEVNHLTYKDATLGRSDRMNQLESKLAESERQKLELQQEVRTL